MVEPQPDPKNLPPADPDDENAMLWCPVCATRLESLKCKLFCRHCGYYMSCADYY